MNLENTPFPPSLNLPEEFLRRMQSLLGSEFPAFLDSFMKPRTFGLRVNTGRISCEEFEKLCPFPLQRIPWVNSGYYYSPDVRPSQSPLYHAGLFYLQDPAAMTPAAFLPVEPGDRILDLCAAPGGKATALGAALKGSGLLFANDISTSRARALLRNLELFGISDLLVADMDPRDLPERYTGFFDKIMLDAPCSGEGMFRKDDNLAKDWSPEKVASLCVIQRSLILQAADMLRPGGMMMYSTCTFETAENEDVIRHLLKECPDMELLPLPSYEGFRPGFSIPGEEFPVSRCVRIFPHCMDAEGHFMALLRKKGASFSGSVSSYPKPAKEAAKPVFEFFLEIGLSSLGGKPIDPSRIFIRADKAYYLPPVLPDVKGLSFLRLGLYLGELKKNRFEPSEPLALAVRKGEAARTIDLHPEDPRLLRYLKGETLSILPEEAPASKGWHLLTVSGYPLGFGKLVNGTFKNKYPAGWRLS